MLAHLFRRVRRELRVAAYAVCIEQGRLLVARFIGDGPEHACWTLPGGGIDHGEDPCHAVVREVEEETGYVIEVAHLLGVNSVRRNYPRGARAVADHHAIRIFYAVRVVGGSLRHEVAGTTDQAAWMPLDQLPPRRADLLDIGLTFNKFSDL